MSKRLFIASALCVLAAMLTMWIKCALSDQWQPALSFQLFVFSVLSVGFSVVGLAILAEGDRHG